MARIYPFRALRYDTSRVRMEDVVTQPYDKITPEMQQRYYERSPYNLVRVILGKREPGDTEPQEFLPPGEPAHNCYQKQVANQGCYKFAEGDGNNSVPASQYHDDADHAHCCLGQADIVLQIVTIKGGKHATDDANRHVDGRRQADQ